MFPHFLPNSVPFELRSVGKAGVNHVQKGKKHAPTCRKPCAKALWSEGIWHAESSKHQLHGWIEAEFVNKWDKSPPGHAKSCLFLSSGK